MQLILKLLDFLVAGVLPSFYIGLVGPPRKNSRPVLEKLLLPVVILIGMDADLVAQIRYRHIFEQVTANGISVYTYSTDFKNVSQLQALCQVQIIAISVYTELSATEKAATRLHHTGCGGKRLPKQSVL